MDNVPCLRVSQCQAQLFRKHLQSKGLLDPSVCVQKGSDEVVLLPLSPSRLSQLDLPSLRSMAAPDSACEIVRSQAPLRSKRTKGWTGGEKLQELLEELLESVGEGWTEELRGDLPRGFQRHGDLILLRDGCFSLPPWRKMDQRQLWSAVAKGLGAKRLARTGRVSGDGFRSPAVTMLFGESSWVKHVDNGIRYEFDVTKCMFSAGNITEKLRVAGFDCRGETVVDLYAGIGYFTLPYLVHARADHVHACEWNPDAVEALRRNLAANGASDRCTVHRGDNRELQLCDVADRVNLGLLPSSEDGWPVACRLLRRATGGVLHIHHGVASRRAAGGAAADGEAWRAWAADAADRVASLLRGVTGAPWLTSVRHVERVKSYAPHVHHVVLDLECRPVRS